MVHLERTLTKLGVVELVIAIQINTVRKAPKSSSTLTTTDVELPFISKDSLNSLVLKTSALLGPTENWLTSANVSNQLLVIPEQVQYVHLR